MQWLYLVQTISTDVVARIAAANLPPLVDGAILIGPEHIAENASPNRIVFVPKQSTFLPRDAVTGRGAAPRTVPQGAGVLSVFVLNHGTSYTTATVTISAPDLAGGVQATASAVLLSGVVHRIQMTAMGSGYTQPPTVTITGNGTSATAEAVLAPTAEQLAAMQQRALWTERQLYEVHVWGCTYNTATPKTQVTNPDTDWDAAATLTLIMLQSLADLAHGVHKAGPMRWRSSDADATKLQMIGRYAIWNLEIDVPVPDVLYSFAPIGTRPVPTVALMLPDGTTSTPLDIG
jgi:hypothetical protein